MSNEESIITVVFGDPGDATIDVKSSTPDTFTESEFADKLLRVLSEAQEEIEQSAIELESEPDAPTPVVGIAEYDNVFAEVSLYLPPGNEVITNVMFGGKALPSAPHHVSTMDVAQRLAEAIAALDRARQPE